MNTVSKINGLGSGRHAACGFVRRIYIAGQTSAAGMNTLQRIEQEIERGRQNIMMMSTPAQNRQNYRARCLSKT